MNRRNFLIFCLFTTIFWFGRNSTSFADYHNPISTFLRKKLLNLPHLKSFQILGKKYLKLYPQEEKTSDLLREFGERLDLAKFEMPSEYLLNQNYWYYWLELKIQQDFQSQETVEIDGWILSKTEAQLCAITTQL